MIKTNIFHECPVQVLAGHVIQDWARPIFRKEDNLAHMSREDRRERDDAMAKRRQGAPKRRKAEEEQEAPARPGDRVTG